MSADFQILPFDFNATTVTFVVISAQAKARMDGAVSVEVRKSAAQQLCDKLESEGFQVSSDELEYQAYLDDQDAAYEESVCASYRARGLANIY